MSTTGLPRSRLLQEARMFREIPRLLARRPIPAPVTNPALVLLVPGLGAHDLFMAPLGRYLRRAGHVVFDSGLGLNLGSVESDVTKLTARLAELTDVYPIPAAPVGWSLGGVIARQLARRLPERVSRVVTFGTPLEGPRYTSLAPFYGEGRTRAIEASIDAHRGSRISAHITAIYSRADGIVDWRSCIDRHNPNVTHVEVRSAHLAMNLDPDVWEAVAHALSGQGSPTAVAAGP